MSSGVPLGELWVGYSPASPLTGILMVVVVVNGGVKTGHVAAQNEASVVVPSAMARALPK